MLDNPRSAGVVNYLRLKASWSRSIAIGGPAVDVEPKALVATCRPYGVREVALFADVLTESSQSSPVRTLVQLHSGRHMADEVLSSGRIVYVKPRRPVHLRHL